MQTIEATIDHINRQITYCENLKEESVQEFVSNNKQDAKRKMIFYTKKLETLKDILKFVNS